MVLKYDKALHFALEAIVLLLMGPIAVVLSSVTGGNWPLFVLLLAFMITSLSMNK